ncbi:hypothetical protein IE53DRAFT_360051 [Violaceomyces palustris]|uniref:Uncharacterized protein n=1 Tax=Violaceomyces palustris TaxID=1673888 RepID=A0ACD0P5Q6_9BASI|nr:hypothetical protein IE53DRAFT_360051 [Violaceomyces palustris]
MVHAALIASAVVATVGTAVALEVNVLRPWRRENWPHGIGEGLKSEWRVFSQEFKQGLREITGGRSSDDEDVDDPRGIDQGGGVGGARRRDRERTHYERLTDQELEEFKSQSPSTERARRELERRRTISSVTRSSSTVGGGFGVENEFRQHELESRRYRESVRERMEGVGDPGERANVSSFQGQSSGTNPWKQSSYDYQVRRRVPNQREDKLVDLSESVTLPSEVGKNKGPLLEPPMESPHHELGTPSPTISLVSLPNEEDGSRGQAIELETRWERDEVRIEANPISSLIEGPTSDSSEWSEVERPKTTARVVKPSSATEHEVKEAEVHQLGEEGRAGSAAQRFWESSRSTSPIWRSADEQGSWLGPVSSQLTGSSYGLASSRRCDSEQEDGDQGHVGVEEEEVVEAVKNREGEGSERQEASVDSWGDGYHVALDELDRSGGSSPSEFTVVSDGAAAEEMDDSEEFSVGGDVHHAQEHGDDARSSIEGKVESMSETGSEESWAELDRGSDSDEDREDGEDVVGGR